MGVISRPKKLGASRQLSAAEVEEAYRSLVSLVGGDVYTNGTPASQNGSLDFMNFSPDAGFRNESKAAPRSIWTIPFHVNEWNSGPSGGSFMSRIQLPFPSGMFSTFEATIIGWTLSFENISSATTSGSALIDKWNSIGESVQVGNTATLTNPAARTAIVNQSGLSVPVTEKDYLRFYFEMSTGSVTIKDIVCIVWLKSKHVR